MSDEQKTCKSKGCEKPARCAIRTQRPTRGNLNTTIYYDERTAPKTAIPYCKECGVAVITGLNVLIDNG